MIESIMYMNISWMVLNIMHVFVLIEIKIQPLCAWLKKVGTFYLDLIFKIHLYHRTDFTGGPCLGKYCKKNIIIYLEPCQLLKDTSLPWSPATQCTYNFFDRKTSYVVLSFNIKLYNKIKVSNLFMIPAGWFRTMIMFVYWSLMWPPPHDKNWHHLMKKSSKIYFPGNKTGNPHRNVPRKLI